jgi:hypothetical protein
MDEQFDNELKNHIRQVFDNFEDPTADAGWLLLREKFPAKKKDRGIIWLWLGSAAAILLLILGIGTWVNYQKQEQDKFVVKTIKTIHHQNTTVVKIQSPVNNKDTLQRLTTTVQPSVQQKLQSHQSSNKTPVKDQLVAAHGSRTNNALKSKTNIADHRLIVKSGANSISNNPIVKTQKKSPEKGDTIATTLANNITVNKANQTNSQQSSAVLSDTIVKKAIVASNTSPRVKVHDPFSDKPETDRRAKASSQDEITNKKVLFSIYAATYFNYAKGSNNQLNIGAGVTSDIRLTQNLKLSTGMAIAQNSLSYANQPPVAATHSFIAAASLSAIQNFANANSMTSVVSFKNYNAQLVGLDVPVNLKYEFDPQKSRNYVVVGLSSGTFINETYTYQYAYGNGYGAAAQSQSTVNGFSNFYFAKTLNVSFGLGYPLSKTNQLIIEPFLKYPLDGLGAQQIKFGAGGINLKFNFNDAKK